MRKAAALLLLAGAACTGSRRDDGLPPLRSHVYRYTAWAEDGTREVVRGWMHLDKVKRGVVGEWWLQPVGDPYPIGPQRGQGRLTGELRDGHLVMDLHPERRDDNVVLVETGEGKNLSGTWEWAGIAGVQGRGTWRATRD